MELKRGEWYRVLRPSSNLVGQEYLDVEEALKEAIHDRVALIVVDCSQITSWSSVGLPVLMSAHSEAVRKELRLVLACVDKRLENIFHVTKITLVFDVYPTVDQAISDHQHRATRV